MKTKSLRLLFVLLVVAVGGQSMAATISGTISYNGTSAGQIYVAVFTDIILSNKPTATVALDSPGSYSITGLIDGTYYMVSIKSTSVENDIKLTDPWGVYGTLGNLTPVTITGDGSVSGIDLILVDGTAENPNPFHREYIQPHQITQLPKLTQAGTNPSIVYADGSIYLYKHDYAGAASAKIYQINPYSGEVITTYNLSLESSANKISWIDKMTVYKGDLWATGGYGDPSGAGGKAGIFKIDIVTSTSSNQIPAGSGVDLEGLGGLANDGVNLFIGVDLTNVQPGLGMVKFDPAQVSAVPVSPFFELTYKPECLCYGDGYLWAGFEDVKKLDPLNGTVLANYNLPGSAASLYLDNMLWTYGENDNTLKAFSLTGVGVAKEKDFRLPAGSYLTQNYPNPFNPSTSISFSLPTQSFVSLKVFDLTGREVATIVCEDLTAGSYSRTWYADGLPSGAYFYRLQAGSLTETRKLVLLR